MHIKPRKIGQVILYSNTKSKKSRLVLLIFLFYNIASSWKQTNTESDTKFKAYTNLIVSFLV